MEHLQLQAAILDNVRDCIIATDIEDRIVYWNSGATTIFGFPENEMLGQPSSCLHRDPSSDDLNDDLHQVMDGQDVVGEWRGRRKDGAEVWVDVRTTLIRDESNRGIGFLRIAKDITERKRVEDALRESEELFRRLSECSPVGVMLMDTEGKSTYCNPRARQILDLSLMASMGEGWCERIHPGDRGWVLREWKDAARAGKEFDREFRFRPSDGMTHWVCLRSAPMASGREELAGHVVTLEEISKRRQMEEEIRASEERFRQIAENIGEVFYMQDVETGRILYVSPAYEELWGRSCDSLYRNPTSFREAIHPDDRERIHPSNAFLEGRLPLLNEYRIVRPDGTVRWVRDRVFPIVNDDGRLYRVAGTASDVTGRRCAEAQRDELLAGEQAARAEAETARDQLRDLSHRLVTAQETERRRIARELHDEVGQLLSAHKMALTLCSRLPQEQAQEKIEQELETIDQLIKLVRTLSLELRPSVLDDLGLLPALMTFCDRYTKQTQIVVDLKHEGLEEIRFGRDVETAVYRFVQEALTNVARHAGVDSVYVRAWTDPEMLSVRVEDRGRGFDPSLVIDGVSSSGIRGMQERASLLRGKLTLDSHPGKGTCVMVEFPVENHRRHRGSAS